MKPTQKKKLGLETAILGFPNNYSYLGLEFKEAI